MLLLAIWIRGRKREIGIYLAIGQSTLDFCHVLHINCKGLVFHAILIIGLIHLKQCIICHKTAVCLIWIRGRKREIGIYLAIGQSKAGIVGQLLAETGITALIAFAVSVLGSNLWMGKVREFLEMFQCPVRQKEPAHQKGCPNRQEEKATLFCSD